MIKYIALTFVFLGWAWYEMSGGSEFEPGLAMAEANVEAEDDAGTANAASIVSRSNTASFDLVSVAGAQGDIAPVSVDPAKIRALAEENVAEVVPDTKIDPEAATVLAAISDEDLSAAAQPRILTDAYDVSPVLQTSRVIEEAPEKDIRYVTGNRVNMRTGPGTKYSVLSKLSQGEEVEVLQEPGNGWIKLRTVESNRIGWMADWLLTTDAQ